VFFFFFSSRRRHTRFSRDWSSDVCSSDLHIWCSTFEVFSLVSAMRSLRELIFFAQRTQRFVITQRTQSGIALSQSLQTLRTALRSEERRVGKECRYGWSSDQEKKKEKKTE